MIMNSRSPLLSLPGCCINLVHIRYVERSKRELSRVDACLVGDAPVRNLFLGVLEHQLGHLDATDGRFLGQVTTEDRFPLPVHPANNGENATGDATVSVPPLEAGRNVEVLWL